jgi:hypothetical protein
VACCGEACCTAEQNYCAPPPCTSDDQCGGIEFGRCESGVCHALQACDVEHVCRYGQCFSVADGVDACVATCDQPCPVGYSCVTLTCPLEQTPCSLGRQTLGVCLGNPTPCTVSTECSSGLVCALGRCVTPCGGASGTTCDPGLVCSNGGCVVDGSTVAAPLDAGAVADASPVVAAWQNHPAAVVVTGTQVLWTNAAPGGLVVGAHLDGTGIFTLANGFDAPTMAANANGVFVTNTDGRVVSIRFDGVAPATMATGLAPFGIAADDIDVYWADERAGTVTQMSPTWGVGKELASGQADPRALAIDATTVYWTNAGDGTIVSVSKQGGTPTVLATGQSQPSTIALDATRVIWTNDGDGTVRAVAKTGGAPVTLASDQGSIRGLAVDDTGVYWTAYDQSAVRKLAPEAASPASIATDQNGPSGIALSNSDVFWSNAIANTVMRASK